MGWCNSEEDNCAWNVAVTLSITNNGFKKVAKNSVRLYLRDDTQFDEGDALLPVVLKVKRLKLEMTVDVTVDFPYDIALAGKYLITVIDPERFTFDRNMTDNIVTVERQL